MTSATFQAIIVLDGDVIMSKEKHSLFSRVGGRGKGSRRHMRGMLCVFVYVTSARSTHFTCYVEKEDASTLYKLGDDIRINPRFLSEKDSRPVPSPFDAFPEREDKRDPSALRTIFSQLRSIRLESFER